MNPPLGIHVELCCTFDVLVDYSMYLPSRCLYNKDTTLLIPIIEGGHTVCAGNSQGDYGFLHPMNLVPPKDLRSIVRLGTIR